MIHFAFQSSTFKSPISNDAHSLHSPVSLFSSVSRILQQTLSLLLSSGVNTVLILPLFIIGRRTGKVSFNRYSISYAFCMPLPSAFQNSRGFSISNPIGLYKYSVFKLIARNIQFSFSPLHIPNCLYYICFCKKRTFCMINIY